MQMRIVVRRVSDLVKLTAAVADKDVDRKRDWLASTADEKQNKTRMDTCIQGLPTRVELKGGKNQMSLSKQLGEL